MKRLFTIFTALFVAITSLVAQTVPEKSINIIASSLRPVQVSPIIGVPIDPMQTDMSNRPCARIKMRVNRMTKAEIGQLEVKIIGGNAQVVRQMVADDGNGLIFEVTARPDLRFYIQHPEFGESNDVQLAVDGNKEYYLDAELNQLFTITIASNTADADIYIDDKFVGRTQQSGSDYLCTVKGVLPGEHKLYLRYGGISTAVQSININSAGSLFFRQNVNIAGSRPQYVVFMVEPTNAIVNIDGKLLTATDGAVMTVLENGTYNYHVTASGYHSQSGTFTVHSAKVTKHITLQMDAATVTLVADAGADIYINDKKVGTGRCEKLLTSGTYIFEARREGYRTQTISRTITSAEPQQTYTFKPLEPVYGRLDIVSTPLMASVAIDGKNVGETPLSLDNVLVGSRKITLSKAGYDYYTTSVMITEGATKNLTATLTKKSVGTTNASLSSSRTQNTFSHYKSSANRKQAKGKGGFNIGLSAGLGAGLSWEDVDVNVGIMWRLWRYNSRFNVTTGATYMLLVGESESFVSFPLMINWNYVRGEKMATYFGLGTEVCLSLNGPDYYDGGDNLHFPICVQFGLGTRHSDFAIYCKGYTNLELVTLGVRYTYLF